MYSICECMICFVAVGWLIFLEFMTEFQSISGRLIGDMEAVHCVSYPFLLFLVRIWCVLDFADVLDAPFLLEEALMYCCVPVRQSGTEMIYQTL